MDRLEELWIESRRQLQERREALFLGFLVRAPRSCGNRDPDPQGGIFERRREFLSDFLALGHPKRLHHEFQELLAAHLQGA